MRQIRPATQDNAIQLRNAIELMRKARGWLAGADCPKAMEALRDAIKSAEGAERHMRHRLNREPALLDRVPHSLVRIPRA